MLADTLLVVDMQKGVLTENSRSVYRKAELVKRVNARIETYRQAQKPIVFIQHDDAYLLKESEDWQLLPELSVRKEDKKVYKQHPDSFYQTELAELLENLKTFEICGAQTEYCLDSTIKAGFDRGYKIYMQAQMSSTFDNAFMTAEQTISFFEGIWGEKFVTFK